MSERNDEPPTIPRDQGESVARNAIIRGEMEGCWIALCDCGFQCGMAILEPNADDRKYVVCPRCEGTGQNGMVRWAKPTEAG